MIDNADWQAILATANDISTVAEFYAPDAVPGPDGFDPADAIARYAAIDDVTLEGNEYVRAITDFGTIKRTIGKEANTASVTFSNVDRQISRFEFNDGGFEGLIMAIRVLSRSLSNNIDKTQILFAGRCDKPSSGSKENLVVSATWILGGPDIQIPRRKYTDYDQDGRTPSDPDFEGFPFTPQYGTTTYSTRVKRGGLAGLIGLKKTVPKTLSYSSHDDLDATKDVPEVLGVAQLLATHIAYQDVGTSLRGLAAVCEGEIYDITNVRSVQSTQTLHDPPGLRYGKIGAANNTSGEGAGWPGNPNGTSYYSRTAGFTWDTLNTSDLTVDDPAPDIAALVWGRLMTIIDEFGDWANLKQFSTNGAAHERWLLTDPDYFNIDTGWLEDEDWTNSYNVCDELILLQTASDFVLLIAG